MCSLKEILQILLICFKRTVFHYIVSIVWFGSFSPFVEVVNTYTMSCSDWVLGLPDMPWLVEAMGFYGWNIFSP